MHIYSNFIDTTWFRRLRRRPPVLNIALEYKGMLLACPTINAHSISQKIHNSKFITRWQHISFLCCLVLYLGIGGNMSADVLSVELLTNCVCLDRKTNSDATHRDFIVSLSTPTIFAGGPCGNFAEAAISTWSKPKTLQTKQQSDVRVCVYLAIFCFRLRVLYDFGGVDMWLQGTSHSIQESAVHIYIVWFRHNRKHLQLASGLKIYLLVLQQGHPYILIIYDHRVE